jgi:prepilin-type N-terminal cleavage/methylation domain-containing protein
MQSKAKISNQTAGFTLIETLITCTLISILATITVPNLLQSRKTANEGVVVGTMRSISTAQFKFKALGLVDMDYNAGHEYGTIGEMTGMQPLRGSSSKMRPNLLSASVSELDANGRFSRSGYHFAVYLPDAGGVGLAETAANLANIDARMTESYWTCLAWPSQYATTGHATYFVNQQGEILKTMDGHYSGSSKVPPAGAALVGVPPDRIDSIRLALNTTGADGSRWVAIK